MGKERAAILKHLEQIALSEGYSNTKTFNGGVWSEPRMLSQAAKAEADLIRTRLGSDEGIKFADRSKLYARLDEIYTGRK